MSKNNKLRREISKSFVDKLNRANIHDMLLQLASIEGVFLVPLNTKNGNKIMVYYYGCRATKKLSNSKIGPNTLEKLDKIKEEIGEKCIKNSKEKDFQYWLAWKLNDEQDTDYRCLCTEYSVPNHTQNKDLGRQDLLIIDKEGNLLILECKYKEASLDGSSGVEAHAKDFRKILGKEKVLLLVDRNNASQLQDDISKDLKELVEAQKALNINKVFDGYSNIKKVKCAFLYIDVLEDSKKRNTEGCPIYKLKYNDDKNQLYCDFKEKLVEAFSHF